MPRELVIGLGQRIRERRLAIGMKQATLAQRAGIATSYLCELETTEGASPSGLVLYQLALALDTTIPYLLGLPPLPAARIDTRAIPPSLARARTRYRLADDEVALLATITYRGRRPQTDEDWYFVICAIRRSVG